MKQGINKVVLTEPEITVEESDWGTKMIKLDKACGHDNITPEMVKYLNSEDKVLLLELFNKVCKYRTIDCKATC